jgi:signal-transduction protein with cAMP-binding, CBS, and nucleotidyltransferase domain
VLLSLEATVRPRRTLKVLSIPLFLLIWGLAGHGHRLVGVVSKRDYARKAILSRSSVEGLIREITTCPFVFVSPRHNVEECMAVMTKHRFRHLRVVQEDAVVGLVSIGDWVKWIITGPAQTVQEVEGYITGAYPG